MSSRKPRFAWKAKKAEELKFFNVPFAVKEYLQNQVGQILKEKKIYEWPGSEWVREDLRGDTEEEQGARKEGLIREYPGLLSGPHGSMLRNSNKRKDAFTWLPVYILSANIPKSLLPGSSHKDALKICTVIWRTRAGSTEGKPLMALSFFNNHLDSTANFGHFVVDGASTSKYTHAVGEKGKGFILATQFLFEKIESTVSAAENSIKNLDKDAKRRFSKCGISFRVGHQVGSLQWEKLRHLSHNKSDNAIPPQLQVILDDLHPYDAETLAKTLVQQSPQKKRPDADSDDDEDELEPSSDVVDPTPAQIQAARGKLGSIYKRRITQKLSVKRDGFTGDVKRREDERPLAQPDEVCITVIGLEWLQPEYLFSAVYGVIPPPLEWPNTDAQITFYMQPRDKMPSFYHRDQLIPHGAPLVHLAINYHGDLTLTADRQSIHLDEKYEWYRRRLALAAHQALTKADTIENQKLAREVAIAIIKDNVSAAGATIGRVLNDWLHNEKSYVLSNPETYKSAFSAAWRSQDLSLPRNTELFPYLGKDSSARDLIAELGMHPVIVSPLAHSVLAAAKAYTGIQARARDMLCASPRVSSEDTVVGASQLRKGIRFAYKHIRDADITFREYSYSYPKAVWDPVEKTFALARPPLCAAHQGQTCTCHVGEHLLEALKDYDSKMKENEADGSGKKHAGLVYFFNAYNHAMDINPLVIPPAQAPTDSAANASANASNGARDASTASNTNMENTEGNDSDDDDPMEGSYSTPGPQPLTPQPAPVNPLRQQNEDVTMSDETISNSSKGKPQCPQPPESRPAETSAKENPAGVQSKASSVFNELSKTSPTAPVPIPVPVPASASAPAPVPVPVPAPASAHGPSPAPAPVSAPVAAAAPTSTPSSAPPRALPSEFASTATSTSTFSPALEPAPVPTYAHSSIPAPVSPPASISTPVPSVTSSPVPPAPVPASNFLSSPSTPASTSANASLSASAVTSSHSPTINLGSEQKSLEEAHSTFRRSVDVILARSIAEREDALRRNFSEKSENLEEQVKTLEGQLKRLHEQVALSHEQMETLKNREEELGFVKSKLSRVEDECDRIKISLDQRVDALHLLKNEYDRLKITLDEKQKELDEVNDRAEAAFASFFQSRKRPRTE